METKHPGGRPSKYKPAMCDEIISLMNDGLSLTAAAAELGICRETVYDWEREIPEFSYAVKLGRSKRTLKLERDLLSASEGPVVTARIFALKNACAAEWREKQDIALTGANGGPIETKDVTPHERAKRTAFALQAAARKGGK